MGSVFLLSPLIVFLGPWLAPTLEPPALPVHLFLATSLGLGFILTIVHCSGRSQGLHLIITLGLIHQQPCASTA